jgi:hypothetical protein
MIGHRRTGLATQFRAKSRAKVARRVTSYLIAICPVTICPVTLRPACGQLTPSDDIFSAN